MTMNKKVRGAAQATLILALAGVAGSLMTGNAWASSTGNKVNNCYGIWFTRDWNQDCTSAGAAAEGTYKSTADCTAPQIPDKTLSEYRFKGDTTSHDGPDCKYGIHTVSTWFQ